MSHVFAGNPLDRGEVERRDAAWLEAAAQHHESRFLVFRDLQVGLRGQQLGWLNANEVTAAAIEDGPYLLGMQEGIAHFAVAQTPNDSSAGDIAFSDCRAAAMILSAAEAGIVAQARANLDWHRRHRFCGGCGGNTQPQRGGQQRVCTACGASHFPRTDPVAIMLVIDAAGDRCLLGQPKGPLVKTGIYSALAGFIDQGECIEEAVRREVMEEAGIAVGEVAYHSSQPWPFPSSLMIGCHGLAVSTDIQMDTTEMHDVQWFTRFEMERAMRGDSSVVKAPGAIAIAHHLIKAWIDGDARL